MLRRRMRSLRIGNYALRPEQSCHAAELRYDDRELAEWRVVRAAGLLCRHMRSLRIGNYAVRS